LRGRSGEIDLWGIKREVGRGGKQQQQQLIDVKITCENIFKQKKIVEWEKKNNGPFRGATEGPMGQNWMR